MVCAAKAILIEWPCVVVTSAIHIEAGNILGHICEDLVHGKWESDSGEVK